MTLMVLLLILARMIDIMGWKKRTWHILCRGVVDWKHRSVDVELLMAIWFWLGMMNERLQDRII